jgi:predicted nucleic acid-binding protein
MRADYRVVLDACVLTNQAVCDLFLRLAETPRLYVPQWSKEILDEVRRTHVEQLDWPADLADYWRSEVEKHFPEAMVDGHERLHGVLANDPKDRHVLATAIKCQAEIIVTFNLRHFPPDALEPWGVFATHPADYLITLYSIESGVVVSKLEAIARQRNRPPELILAQLGQSVPPFAAHVADSLGWELPEWPPKLKA